MKSQAVVAFALILLLILFGVLALLALGAAAPGRINVPAPVTTGKYPDPVSIQVQEGGETMMVSQQTVDYLAAQSGATAAQVVASLNSLVTRAGLVQAGEQAVAIDTEGRLTHLLKDIQHVTAWLVVKMVLRRADGDAEVYHCPATGEYCDRYAIVVRDEWGQLCAVAFVKASDGKLITSFYRGCAALLQQMTARLGCKRVFHVRFVIP